MDCLNYRATLITFLLLLLPIGAQAATNDDLVSFWKFDESSGTAADSHGINTLTNNNTATFVAAKINNGTDLELGSLQYFSILDASQKGLDIEDDMTLAGWVKFETSPAAIQPFVMKRVGATNNRSYSFYMNGVSSLNFDWQVDGLNAGGGAAVSWTPSTATWYHIAMVKDGAAIKFYVDGSQVASTFNGTHATMFNGIAQVELGGWVDGAAYFDGVMDEWGIWERALTSTEISELYNTGTGISYSSLTTCDPATTTCIKRFNVPGYAEWTAPADVTSAQVACWGGGGGGGDGTTTGGGGGGGGAFASSTVAVTAGTKYTLFIGAGGSHATSAAGNGFNGATSTFATTTVVAAPGWRGMGGTSIDAVGGIPGATASSTGDVVFAGGNGGAGNNTSDGGGGGGGGGGPHGAGGAGAAATATVGGGGGGGNGGNAGALGVGGTSVSGGKGGNGDTGAGLGPVAVTAATSPLGGGGSGGGDDGTSGTDGSAYGGGGGGGENTSTDTIGFGGRGGCTITYAASAAASAAPQDDTYFEILESYLWLHLAYVTKSLAILRI